MSKILEVVVDKYLLHVVMYIHITVNIYSH